MICAIIYDNFRRKNSRKRFQSAVGLQITCQSHKTHTYFMEMSTTISIKNINFNNNGFFNQAEGLRKGKKGLILKSM